MKSVNLEKIKKYKKLLNKTRNSIRNNYSDAINWYAILKALGIKSNAYVGSRKLKYNSRKSILRKLEWYIGQYIAAFEKSDTIVLITWENCFDKFVNNVKYKKPKLQEVGNGNYKNN